MNIDEQIQEVYKHVDSMLRREQFLLCNAELKQVDIQTEELDILLAWLVATLPARSRLADREEFKRKVADQANIALDGPLLRGL